MSILKSKTAAKTKAFRVRLPAALLDEIDTLTTEADAAGLVLDVQEIVANALTAAAKSARAELAQTTVR